MCSSSAGAAIAAAQVLGRDFGGEVRFIGTPAEEAGNGKVHLIAAGLFDDVDVCLQIHPSDSNSAEVLALAITEVGVTFHGKLAHASADPWLGKNALDAIVLLYTMVAQWRQHLKHGERVHGIITHGGAAPNIVPDLTTGRWYLRTPVDADLDAMVERFGAMADAAASATGCTVELKIDPDEPMPDDGQQPDPARDLAPPPGRCGHRRRPDRPERRQHRHGERQPRGADDPPVPGRSRRAGRPATRASSPPMPAAPTATASSSRRFGILAATGVELIRNPDKVEAAWRELRDAARPAGAIGLSDILAGHGSDDALLAELYDLEHDAVTEDLGFYREWARRTHERRSTSAAARGGCSVSCCAGARGRSSASTGRRRCSIARSRASVPTSGFEPRATTDGSSWRCGDVRTVRHPHRFRLAIMAGVIAHLDGPEDAVRALGRRPAAAPAEGRPDRRHDRARGRCRRTTCRCRSTGSGRWAIGASIRRSRLVRAEAPEGLRVEYSTLTDVVEPDGTIARLPAGFRLWYPSPTCADRSWRTRRSWRSRRPSGPTTWIPSTTGASGASSCCDARLPVPTQGRIDARRTDPASDRGGRPAGRLAHPVAIAGPVADQDARRRHRRAIGPSRAWPRCVPTS